MESYSAGSGSRWYAFSLKNQACMGLCPPLGEELADALGERRRLFEVGKVSSLRDCFQAGAGDGLPVGRPVVVRGDEPIVGAPQEHGGDGDALEPAPQLGIVKVGLPDVLGR